VYINLATSAAEAAKSDKRCAQAALAGPLSQAVDSRRRRAAGGAPPARQLCCWTLAWAAGTHTELDTTYGLL